MAQGRYFYKRNGGDILMAVLGFPDSDHKWAYSAIIDMLNDRDRPIPDDPGFVCGFTGLSKQKWRHVRTYLLDGGYLVLKAGMLSNPRFDREHAGRRAERDQAVEWGREGGLASAAARAESSNKPATKSEKSSNLSGEKLGAEPVVPLKSNDKSEAPPQAIRARQSLETRDNIGGAKTPTVVPEKPEPLNWVNRMGQAAGVAVFPNRPQHFADQVQAVTQWFDLGLDPEADILPALRRDAEKSDQPRYSLAYFNPHMAKIAARKDRPDAPVTEDHASPLVRAALRAAASGGDR